MSEHPASTAATVAVSFLEAGDAEAYALHPLAEADIPAVLEAEHTTGGDAALERAVRDLLGLAMFLEHEGQSPQAADTLRRIIGLSHGARAILDRRAGDASELRREAAEKFAALSDVAQAKTAPQVGAPVPEGSVKLGGLAPLARRA